MAAYFLNSSPESNLVDIASLRNFGASQDCVL